MHRISLFLFCLLTASVLYAQPNAVDEIIIPKDTSKVDLNLLARQITGKADGNPQKAETLLKWLSGNFQWLSTDYQKRTVKEIIVRKGGNCFEMAKVYMELLRYTDIKYRPVAEIHLETASNEREKSARDMVRQTGNRASLFGKYHNDHRWVEVLDEKTGNWIPVDPTMGVFGLDAWLKARVWFGERKSVNYEISKQMIVPVAIFVVSTNNKYEIVIDRTEAYLLDYFNNLYEGKLAGLKAWPQWKKQVYLISTLAKKTFENNENLLLHKKNFRQFNKIYWRLKKEWVAESQ